MNHSQKAHKIKISVSEHNLRFKKPKFNDIAIPHENDIATKNRLTLLKNSPEALYSFKSKESHDMKRLNSKKRQEVLNNRLFMDRARALDKKLKNKIHF